ncbi:MAG: hypothetical protein IJ254_03325 [Succinivibrio sp.]|nr:hypothetical protein [Succinivibrio sp.]
MFATLKRLLFPVIPVFISACSLEVNTNKDVPNLEKGLSEVFYMASLAPSAHNTQMYKVTVNPDLKKVQISLDNSRLLKVTDPLKRESLISLGAYVRALELAYLAYGYKTETDVNKDYVAIYYSQSESADIKVPDNKLLTLMLKRHTDKRDFKTDKIAPNVLNEISLTIKNTEYLARQSHNFTFFKDTFMKAFKQQSFDKATAKELSNWMRFSDKETLTHKDGLSAELLGITGVKKFFYYTFMDHDSVLKDSFATKSLEIAKAQANNCAGYLTLKSKSDSFYDLINTGKSLYDLMLYLTDKDIAIQPLSAPLEDPAYRALLSDKLHTKDKLQMILRIGYVDDYGKNNKLRRDLKDYIQVESSH